MRLSRPLAERNSRNACAVVAKPPGTRMPAAASAFIISPSEAFLPPTRSRSAMRRSLSQATRIALVFYRHESAAHRVLRFRRHRHHGADSRAQPADAVRRSRFQPGHPAVRRQRSEEHTSELQSLAYLVCRLLLEKKKKIL